jgi:hypothetical protein
MGIVADSKAYCKRTLGLCLEKRIGLITLVTRTCTVWQELETCGQQQGPLPLLVEKPGRIRIAALAMLTVVGLLVIYSEVVCRPGLHR